MRTSTGLSTEVVFIFNNMLRKLSKQYDPPYIAAIFESGEATHRVQEFAEYKANRVETPPDLLDQIPIVRRILEAMRRLMGEQISVATPVLLCSTPARYHVKRLLEPFLPKLVVLSPLEVPPVVELQPMGVLK